MAEQLSVPRIAVVVPVHNREHLILRTLESIKKQDYRPFRLILVDNNSTDKTLETIQQWASRNREPEMPVLICSEPHPGATAARNRGLKEVTEEYLMFFDSDDTMAPEHIGRAMSAFSSPQKPDIVGWNVLYSTPAKTWELRFDSRDAIWHALMHGSMGTQRYAARTEIFRRAGGWDTSVMGWNDAELGVRILSLSPSPIIQKLKGKPTVSVYFTRESITGANFSNNSVKWEYALDCMEKFFGENSRKKRWINFRRALLAGDYRREKDHDKCRQLLKNALQKESNPFYRFLFRLTTLYVGHGGRGAALLLRPLF